MFFRYDYPGRAFILRYEDLCYDPVGYGKKLTQFLGLPYLQSVQEYILKHTNTTSLKATGKTDPAGIKVREKK